MQGRDTLSFASNLRPPFEPYLPPAAPAAASDRPFVTLTYAASLDSRIASAPGEQTALSGPASKAMTHFLRTRHDAILVGSGTALADDPTLTSRLADAHSLDFQPRPVVLDRRGRWKPSAQSNVVRAASRGAGRGPWVLVDPAALEALPDAQRQAVAACGGRHVPFAGQWPDALQALRRDGVASVMVEGGGQLINSLLTHHPDLVDSLIVTIAPVYLGTGGVAVSPAAALPPFEDVRWLPLERDVVLCAKRMP